MNWKTFWQQQGSQSDPLLQVGRQGGTLDGQYEWLEEYAAYIASQLQLTADDVLLDVCCGNGLLTHHLSKYCKAVLGVDFSESHIRYASEHFSNASVQFVCADALKLGETDLEKGPFEQGFTKATLCFSFQYFESVQAGLQVVAGILKHTKKELLLTDIPDRDKFMTYYNTPMKLLRLAKQMLLQQNDMGKFWGENELGFISGLVHKSGRKIIQPASFPYAYYRMDYLFSE
jgi:ubiquinone/menaquinone biosynthesis C-methylase UbiE